MKLLNMNHSWRSQAAWDAAGEVIRTWATEGHSVPLPGLGTMRFGVRRIIFTPNVDMPGDNPATSLK